MLPNSETKIRITVLTVITVLFLYLCYILLIDDLSRGMMVTMLCTFSWWCVVEWAIPQESREGLCETSGCSNRATVLCPYCGNHYCEDHSTIKAKGRIVT